MQAFQDRPPSARIGTSSASALWNHAPLQQSQNQTSADDVSFEPRRTVILRAREMFAHQCGWDNLRELPSFNDREAISVVSALGNGSLGLVEEVEILRKTGSKDSYGFTFARKRVFLRQGRQQHILNIIQTEAEIVRSLVHTHIIHVFGTYQSAPSSGPRTFSLLMFPVCDEDLSTFLQDFYVGPDDISESLTVIEPRRSWLRAWFTQNFAREQETDDRTEWIRHWFSCLSSALDYIHTQGVRHQDIKPSNIVHLREHIFFTDFSSAAQFSPGATTSTEGPARSSAMYCAPEMLRYYDEDVQEARHGTLSDIFSLGCVFFEMLVVLSGCRLSTLHDRMQRFSAPGGWQYAKEMRRLDPITLVPGDEYTSLWKNVVKPMVSQDRKRRPTARQTVEALEQSQFPTCKCAPTYLPGYPDTQSTT